MGQSFSKQVGWVYTVQMGPAALCFGIDKWEDLFRIVLCFQIFTGVLIVWMMGFCLQRPWERGYQIWVKCQATKQYLLKLGFFTGAMFMEDQRDQGTSGSRGTSDQWDQGAHLEVSFSY